MHDITKSMGQDTCTLQILHNYTGNTHFASQFTIVWNWVMQVLLVEAEMRDWGCLLWICSVKANILSFTGCSTTAFLYGSILGALLKDLAVQIWAFEMFQEIKKHFVMPHSSFHEACITGNPLSWELNSSHVLIVIKNHWWLVDSCLLPFISQFYWSFHVRIASWIN